jgi:hypothetical protein
VEASGNLFWWSENDNIFSCAIQISKGWQIIRLDHLPEWQGMIEKVRLDPGNIPHSNIMIDWFAISAQPISTEMTDEMILPQRKKLELITSPDSTEGNYTITVDYQGKSDSITIFTTRQNSKPVIQITKPTKDTILEKGSNLTIKTHTSDRDGKVDHVLFYADNNPFYQSYGPSFEFDQEINTSGTFQVTAEAIDDQGGSSVSNSITVSFVEQTPYHSAHTIPGVIEAEDYDQGGANIAYMDTDDVNEGGVYRNDGVDIGKNNGNYDGYFVGWIRNGEWLEYTLESKINLKAELTVWVASEADTGEFHLEIDNNIATPHQFVPNTGGLNVYKKVKVFDVPVRKGKQKLKLYFDKGGFNVNKLEIKRYKSKFNKPISEYCLRLYPNPTNDYIRFTYKEALNSKVEIFNMMGQKMDERFLESRYTQEIDISSLSPGVYIMRVTFENCHVMLNRFVKY